MLFVSGWMALIFFFNFVFFTFFYKIFISKCMYIVQYSSLIDKNLSGTRGFTDLSVMGVCFVSLFVRLGEGI